MQCPLCLSKQTKELPLTADGKRYFHCPQCDLRFLCPSQRLDPAEEHNRYRTHENHFFDLRYQRFLMPLCQSVRDELPPRSLGLDYGCGPNPVLAQMFQMQNYSVASWDPYFAPDGKVLEGSYDFICVSEAAEHFYHPHQEFAQLSGLIKPNGLLLVMTALYRPDIDFASWYYRRDPTHVVFYSENTFGWISSWLGFAPPSFVNDRLAVLRKTPLQ